MNGNFRKSATIYVFITCLANLTVKWLPFRNVEFLIMAKYVGHFLIVTKIVILICLHHLTMLYHQHYSPILCSTYFFKMTLTFCFYRSVIPDVLCILVSASILCHVSTGCGWKMAAHPHTHQDCVTSHQTSSHVLCCDYTITYSCTNNIILCSLGYHLDEC